MQARGTGQGFSQIIGYENIGIFLSNFPVQYNLHKLTISIRYGQILYKKHVLRKLDTGFTPSS